MTVLFSGLYETVIANGQNRQTIIDRDVDGFRGLIY
jgi:hypothetical protein